MKSNDHPFQWCPHGLFRLQWSPCKGSLLNVQYRRYVNTVESMVTYRGTYTNVAKTAIASTIFSMLQSNIRIQDILGMSFIKNIGSAKMWGGGGLICMEVCYSKLFYWLLIWKVMRFKISCIGCQYDHCLISGNTLVNVKRMSEFKHIYDGKSNVLIHLAEMKQLSKY